MAEMTQDILEAACSVLEQVSAGTLSVNEGLWQQAFTGFVYFTGGGHKTGERQEEKLRRLLFTRKMGGRNESGFWCLPDGSRYASLTEEALLNKMVKQLHECFLACHLTRDYGINENISVTSYDLIQLIRRGTIDRNVLQRLAFALQLCREEFDDLLNTEGRFRALSVAVPRDLILLYCIENGCWDWEKVNELQELAETYRQEMDNLRAVPLKEQNLYTEQGEKNWGRNLAGLSEEIFRTKNLRFCCAVAVRKEITTQKITDQYSYSAWKLVQEQSVLGELAQAGGNSTSRNRECVYSTTVICNYAKCFDPEGRYRLPDKGGRQMSLDNYCQFFSYRFQLVRKKHCCLDHSRLPLPLQEQRLTYSSMNNLFLSRRFGVGNTSFRPHRIWRYMILLVTFYHQQMLCWKEDNRLITESADQAKKRWSDFHARANRNLKDSGYGKTGSENPGSGEGLVSNRYPLDFLLHYCLTAVNPLECYNRIYELAVLDSLAHDPQGWSDQRYPDPDRIRRVLDELQCCGAETVRDFCAAVSRQLPETNPERG